MRCLGSVSRRCSGVDADNLLCSCGGPLCTEDQEAPESTALALGLSCPHTAALWPACLEPTLRGDIASAPQNNTQITFFPHSCDRMDYSFLHKIVCHCQHQKLPPLCSGSTCLIDWVPSEQLTHTKQLNLSDFKSKVRQATSSGAALT